MRTRRFPVVVALLALVVLPAASQGKKDPHAKLVAELVARHGDGERARIERGVAQVAALWKKSDGELAAFCREHFLPAGAALDAAFARFEKNLEQLDGHLLEIGRELRFAADVDTGEMLAVDPLFAAYDPYAHVTEDLFAGKLGFVVLLNFPLTTLAERLDHQKTYTRREWAEVRLAGRFARRVPAEVSQEVTRAAADADLYISGYNLWMHHVLAEKGERLFPSGKRLISHWNLRDELKAAYAEKDGLARQRVIVKVMERIVTQDIPQVVIDNPRVDWNPFTNEVAAAPADTVEKDAPAGKPAAPAAAREPDTRYGKLLANHKAARKADPYSPKAPTQIARAFELGAEMPEERVKELLTSVLSSVKVARVAKLIEKRLGRPLEPQDLWYNGFLARGSISEDKLDQLTRKRYPTPEAFAQDIPRLLEGLGFDKARAKYLAEHVRVDPSRGAGHALQSARRGDFARLRTRVEKDGMNYKGYNIAVHELGHNVEQVFSLYDVDHTLLAGVPNTAFTEALAFVFQARDLELLGQAKPDVDSERQRVLGDFWATWEIAGVALVDVAVWHWMYDHPKATPAQLRAATMKIAAEIWDQYYAPVLGGKGSVLLGIYSHMVSYPLYLFNYPLGHLIAFQIEEHMRKSARLGPEFERMSKHGAVTPDAWMEHATGSPVSAQPLLDAVERALAAP